MIEFVYFDIGGVVIRDFDGTDNWENLKKELGVTPEKSDKFESVWHRYSHAIDTSMPVDDMKEILNEELGLSIPENLDLLDGFVSRFDKNEIIWPIIEEVKKHHKIGLLTNMYQGMLAAIRKKRIFPNISFDILVDSSIEGVKKPDSAIFKLAEEKCGYQRNEILFIDNSEKNIIAARKAGWNTFWYKNDDIVKSNQELQRYLVQLGIID